MILLILKSVHLDILMRIAAKCVNIQHLGKGVLICVLVKNTRVASCVGAQMASIYFFIYGFEVFTFDIGF